MLILLFMLISAFICNWLAKKQGIICVGTKC